MTSPIFLVLTILGGIVLLVVTILWKNIHWEPRHITSSALVDRLRVSARLLPKTKWGWGVLLMIVLAALVTWGLYRTHNTLSEILKAPSVGTVGGFVSQYWLWILIALLAGYVVVISPLVPDGYKKGAQFVIAGVIGLFVVSLIWYFIEAQSTTRAYTPVRESSVPLASSPQSTWPVLIIPAKGRSIQIPVPVGKRVTFAGYDFLAHTQYANGQDCSGGNCPDGQVTSVYAENLRNADNTIQYAYTPVPGF